MGAFIELSGQCFNRLTVIKVAFKTNKRVYWECKCVCGKSTNVHGNKLRSGHTQSCGCLGEERRAETAFKHGFHKSRFYATWKAMLYRCEDPKNHGYHCYGGRGITVCEEWRNSIEAFHNWCANSDFKEGLTLDRIDVNGNYEPSNCRWATDSEQSNNMQNTVYVFVNGEKHTITDIQNKYGMSRTAAHKYAKIFENFQDALDKWNYNKIHVKNQWNTNPTLINKTQ